MNLMIAYLAMKIWNDLLGSPTNPSAVTPTGDLDDFLGDIELTEKKTSNENSKPEKPDESDLNDPDKQLQYYLDNGLTPVTQAPPQLLSFLPNNTFFISSLYCMTPQEKKIKCVCVLVVGRLVLINDSKKVIHSILISDVLGWLRYPNLPVSIQCDATTEEYQDMHQQYLQKIKKEKEVHLLIVNNNGPDMWLQFTQEKINNNAPPGLIVLKLQEILHRIQYAHPRSLTGSGVTFASASKLDHIKVFARWGADPSESPLRYEVLTRIKCWNDVVNSIEAMKETKEAQANELAPLLERAKAGGILQLDNTCKQLHNETRYFRSQGAMLRRKSEWATELSEEWQGKIDQLNKRIEEEVQHKVKKLEQQEVNRRLRLFQVANNTHKLVLKRIDFFTQLYDYQLKFLKDCISPIVKEVPFGFLSPDTIVSNKNPKVRDQCDTAAKNLKNFLLKLKVVQKEQDNHQKVILDQMTKAKRKLRLAKEATSTLDVKKNEIKELTKQMKLAILSYKKNPDAYVELVEKLKAYQRYEMNANTEETLPIVQDQTKFIPDSNAVRVLYAEYRNLFEGKIESIPSLHNVNSLLNSTNVPNIDLDDFDDLDVMPKEIKIDDLDVDIPKKEINIDDLDVDIPKKEINIDDLDVEIPKKEINIDLDI